jgi:(p)ppGpp synthase/HD superfamily hydrolase
MSVPISNIYHIPEALPFPVNVALALARKAHPLELRRKPFCGPQVPYLAHPVLTCKILLAHGIKDSVPLMAALLHDAVEEVKDPRDAGRYINNLKKLQQDLRHELAMAGHAEPDILAARVALVVDELTHSKVGGRGKLMEQLVHANNYSNTAKLVKMADHAATLVDDLFIPPKDNHEKRMSLLHRVRSVANACQILHDSSIPYEQAAARLRQYVHWLANQTSSFLKEGKGRGGETLEELQTEILSNLELHLNLILSYRTHIPESKIETGTAFHTRFIYEPVKYNNI